MYYTIIIVIKYIYLIFINIKLDVYITAVSIVQSDFLSCTLY